MALIKLNNRSSEDNAIHGRRNLFINGSMQVDQRGLGFTMGNSATYMDRQYFCDRLWWETGGMDELVVVGSRETDAPDGFKYSSKVTVSTPETTIADDGEFAQFIYLDEAANWKHLRWGHADAKNITVTFWVKASQTGTFGFAIHSPSGDVGYGTSYSITATDTWEKKTFHIPAPTTNSSKWDRDKIARGIEFRWLFLSGSTNQAGWVDGQWVDTGTGYDGFDPSSDNNTILSTNGATFQLAGIQMEEGDQATPFEHIPYGEELFRCRRYSQVFMGDGNYSQIGGTGIALGSTLVDYPIVLSPKMRTTGTAHLYGTVQVSNASSGFACSAVGVVTQQSSSDIYSIRATTSGTTGGAAYRLESANNTTARFLVNAEI